MHVITTRRDLNRWAAAGATAFIGALGWSDLARADAVTDWHEIAANTLCSGPATPPRSGPVGLLDMAIIQAAVYDAVQNIGGKYKPYLTTISGASGSPEAAAAKAAHDALVAFYAPKAEELGKTYNEYLARKGLKEDDPGVAVGQKAAASIIAEREKDGRVPSTTPVAWMGETKVGLWRPTPGRGKIEDGMAAPWLGSVKPFVIQSSRQFQPNKKPPALTSEEYAKDFNEVKLMGGKENSKRTPEQQELADFWTTDKPFFCRASMGTIREPVAAHVKDINESSRAIALASLAVADAAITVWNTKKNDHTWRPITAIHEADKDDNPATEPDPAWQPYLNTPPYSDWTSGANSVLGAITRTYTNFFGKDDVTFTIANESPAQKTRTYNRFSDLANDIVNVRVYHGVHFRFADVAGREQGEKVADEVFRTVATPK